MLRIAILGFLMLLFVSPLRAEGMADQAYTATLLELNRVKPGQNPDLILGKNQLNGRILDKNQRTIGKVRDILVAPNGKFETVLTKIDVSGFREEVAFDVASYVTEPTPDTFTVALDKDQLKQNMPKLMAATNTAAGSSSSLTISSLQNGTIYKPDGTVIAKVKDVLIDTRNMQISSLVVKLSSGNNRGAEIAIPYEAAAAKLNGNKVDLTVTDAQAEVIASMAKR
ncbi:MAG: hypothetical protein DI586_09040 [Micavibrio aeruginosavorus]|uniref:PRC-barrel domain-containing protein n=1 Tax=Micavibrio aeruginosavorus TaxID=349221 RepID=A0A2W5FLN9_9BACT|nr:MAG: hypothetical protein DI586_09040 [Micavibrio aeruginosavorus]